MGGGLVCFALIGGTDRKMEREGEGERGRERKGGRERGREGGAPFMHMTIELS